MDNKLEIILAAKDITGKTFDKVQASISSLGKNIVSVNGIIAGFAGAAGLGLIVKNSIDAIAELDRLATMAGVNAEAFQELSFAADQYQITQDALTDGMKELSLRGDEFAKTGAGSAKESFERLGYTTKQVNSLLEDTPVFLSDIISKMEGLDKASQIRIADELFGGQGGEQFVKMIQGGSKALDTMRQSARDLGAVIDNDMVKQSVEAKKQVEQLTRVLSSQFNSVVAELAPDISEIAIKTTDWIKANRELINQGIGAVARGIGDSFDYVSQVVSKTAEAVQKLIDIYNKMPQGLLSRFAEGQLEQGRAYLESLNNGVVTKSIDKNTPGYAEYMARNTDISTRTVTAFTPKPKATKSAKKEAEDTAAEIASAYQYAYSSLDSMTQETFDYMLGQYQKDYDAFIKLTGDKETALALYSQNIADLTSKMYGDSSDSLESLKEEQEAIKAFEKRQIELKLQAESEFADAYKQATMTSTAYDLDQLQDRYNNYSQFIDDKAKLDEWYAKEQKNIIDKQTNEWAEAIKEWSNSFATTLNDMVWGADTSFKEIAVSFAKMLTQMAIQKAVSGVFDMAATGISGLFSAHGNVFPSNAAGISAYSNSIVNSPTVFPFASGIGIMGEAGAEAILPLTRTSSGNLGVEATGTGGGFSVELNITNKTNQNVAAKQDGIKFDSASKKMIVGIILEAAENNTSGLRTSIKRIVAS